MYLFFSMIEGRQSDPSISAASATGMGYSNSLRVQPVVTPLRVMNALFPEIRMLVYNICIRLILVGMTGLLLCICVLFRYS